MVRTRIVNGFTREFVNVAEATVLVRRAGHGPAVLLLHGYPETSLAWRKVAPDLAQEFTVIAPDLPGYGESTIRETAIEEGRISKRTMGRILADVMTELGIRRFAVIGHDRGGRVAYRLALDDPDRVRALVVLDVVPILDMAEHMTYEAAREMAHWFWSAQPTTVPETLVGLDAGLYVRHIVEQWHGAGAIEEDVVEEYIRCMRRPEVLRAIGAEYRADTLDLEHDRQDRLERRRISSPLLALWAQGGLVERFGDPLAIWRTWADRVSGSAMTAGHFLMEQSPQEVLASVRPFLSEAFENEQSKGDPTDSKAT